MKTKVFVRILTLLLLLATLTSLVGCSAARTVRASSNADDVVATAGEIEILYDEYYYVAMTRLAHLKEQYGEDALSDPQVLAEFRAFVQDNLLTKSHALLALGLSYGIDIEQGPQSHPHHSPQGLLLFEERREDRAARGAGTHWRAGLCAMHIPARDRDSQKRKAY